MESTKKTIEVFCDWVTVTQTHEEKHQPIYQGINTYIDGETGESNISYAFKQLSGKEGSTLTVKSDGHRVQLSGNVSRWNRAENYQGITLDEVKIQANLILRSLGLPEFTGGQVVHLNDGSATYTGAKFSRIDMTENVSTGSKDNLSHYQQWLQTQKPYRLKRTVIGQDTYYGYGSASRTISSYNKAEQIRNVLIPAARDKATIAYLKNLADWLENNGIIRKEVQYKNQLRKKGWHMWHVATQAKLSSQFKKDIHRMTKEVRAPDYGDIPTPVLGTLTMYMAGIDVKERLSENTYYKHRKILSEYGYDISSRNVRLLQPKVKIITLEPAGVPDFYRHHEPIKPVAAQKHSSQRSEKA